MSGTPRFPQPQLLGGAPGRSRREKSKASWLHNPGMAGQEDWAQEPLGRDEQGWGWRSTTAMGSSLARGLCRAMAEHQEEAGGDKKGVSQPRLQGQRPALPPLVALQEGLTPPCLPTPAQKWLKAWSHPHLIPPRVQVCPASSCQPCALQGREGRCRGAVPWPRHCLTGTQSLYKVGCQVSSRACILPTTKIFLPTAVIFLPTTGSSAPQQKWVHPMWT